MKKEDRIKAAQGLSILQLLDIIRDKTIKGHTVAPEDNTDFFKKELPQTLRSLDKKFMAAIKTKSMYNKGTQTWLYNLSNKMHEISTLSDSEIIKKKLAIVEQYIVKPTPLLEINPKFEYKDGLNNHKSIADTLVNVQAYRYLKEAFKNDFDLINVSLADAADIIKLARFIYMGDLKKVAQTSQLDTIVREEIPKRVWAWLQKHVYTWRS